MPSPFLSSMSSRPVASQVRIQESSGLLSISAREIAGPLVGVAVIAAGHMVVVRFSRAMAPTAGATVYSMAMKTSAQPADERASATLGTVKKRMITGGRPAVPIMSDSVNRNMLSLFVVSEV